MVTLLMFVLAGLLAWGGMENPEESQLMFILAGCCALFGLVYIPFKNEAKQEDQKKK
jgi:hypothetical protein